MDTLSLITLFLAVATFLLAIAAFWSISQNNKSQKRERRERLLNEIIEWANEVVRGTLDVSLQAGSKKEIKRRWVFRYMALEKSARYFLRIADLAFRKTNEAIADKVISTQKAVVKYYVTLMEELNIPRKFSFTDKQEENVFNAELDKVIERDGGIQELESKYEKIMREEALSLLEECANTKAIPLR